MSRIRSIHPGLWTDSAFINLSMPAGLLFIGLWNFADDNGIFEWHIQALKLKILPARRVNIHKLFQELLNQNLIEYYEVQQGAYGQIRNFRKWQKPQRPVYKYPVKEEREMEDRELSLSLQLGTAPDEVEEWKGKSQAEEQLDYVKKDSEQRDLKEIFCTGKERKEKKREQENNMYSPDLTDHICNKGIRLPLNWYPDEECCSYAEKLGLDFQKIAEDFRDYWHAKTGQSAIKRDWNATWRNWCRKSRVWQKNALPTAYYKQGDKKHPLDWMIADYQRQWGVKE